jgi:uncharacterized damage-inducible protein DinB
MQPASTIRKWQFEELGRTIGIVRFMLQGIPADDLRTYRDGGAGWTVLEVLCHLRDFDEVFVQRLRLTVEQEQAALPVPNPDQWAVERRYNEQDLHQVLDAWSQNRDSLLTDMNGLFENDWARKAVHPVRGLMTATDQLLLMTWHDWNHTEQIVKILWQRPT